MNKEAPVSVRFSETESSRLDQVSGLTGIPKAEIIRRATAEYLDKVDAEGKITIVVREPRPKYPAARIHKDV